MIQSMPGKAWKSTVITLFAGALAASAGQAQERNAGAGRCPQTASAGVDGVVVGWTTGTNSWHSSFGHAVVEPFRPAVLLKGSSIRETEGSSIAIGQRFWRAVSPGEDPVTLQSAGAVWNTQGADHCVYSATVSDPSLPRFTLLTSQPLAETFRPANEAEKQMARQIWPECRSFADHAGDQPPPCRRREILAVSDINRNGRSEYWTTEHYAWDTGLTVVEENSTSAPLVLLRVCKGCAD